MPIALPQRTPSPPRAIVSMQRLRKREPGGLIATRPPPASAHRPVTFRTAADLAIRQMVAHRVNKAIPPAARRAAPAICRRPIHRPHKSAPARETRSYSSRVGSMEGLGDSDKKAARDCSRAAVRSVRRLESLTMRPLPRGRRRQSRLARAPTPSAARDSRPELHRAWLRCAAGRADRSRYPPGSGGQR